MIKMHPLGMLHHWFMSNGRCADDVDTRQVAREPIAVPEPAINVVPWGKGMLFQIVWQGGLVEWETLH